MRIKFAESSVKPRRSVSSVRGSLLAITRFSSKTFFEKSQNKNRSSTRLGPARGAPRWTRSGLGPATPGDTHRAHYYAVKAARASTSQAWDSNPRTRFRGDAFRFSNVTHRSRLCAVNAHACAVSTVRPHSKGFPLNTSRPRSRYTVRTGENRGWGGGGGSDQKQYNTFYTCDTPTQHTHPHPHAFVSCGINAESACVCDLPKASLARSVRARSGALAVIVIIIVIVIYTRRARRLGIVPPSGRPFWFPRKFRRWRTAHGYSVIRSLKGHELIYPNLIYLYFFFLIRGNRDGSIFYERDLDAKKFKNCEKIFTFSKSQNDNTTYIKYHVKVTGTFGRQKNNLIIVIKFKFIYLA